VVVHVPLPHQDARQELRYLHLSKAGFQEELVDVHGQRLARYAFDQIPAGGFAEAIFVAGATLRSLRWIDPGRPERPGGPPLSAAERARYLAPASNYSMGSPVLRETAGRLVEGARTEREKVERIHDFILAKVRYIRDGRWDPAEQVLRQGHGSCSEYNYLLSGLLRLAGLPTRYVGGSSRASGALPATDLVYHRWTEVFLEGVGWFPVDCSRDANPLRGKRSHFGRVHSDMLVWCRQAGGGEDLLGWEYRAQARSAEGGPRLRAEHRTRWFESVSAEDLAAARAWLAAGTGAAPGGDALECALLDWDGAAPASRRRLIEGLARAGRAECLRRAAGFVDERGAACDLYGALCAEPELAEILRDVSRDANRLRAWFRGAEDRLLPDGRGAFRLQPAPGRAQAAPASGSCEPLWTEMVGDVLAALKIRLAECSPGPVVLLPVADLSAGECVDLEKLGGRLESGLMAAGGRALIDREALARHMQTHGPGRGAFWTLAFPESGPPGGGLPAGLRPALVIAPVALVEPIDGEPRERRLLLELRLLDLPRGLSSKCVQARLHRSTPEGAGTP